MTVWSSIFTPGNISKGSEITMSKDDAVKVLHSIYQQIWKTQQWPQGWKRSVFIPIPKKGNAKECSNYHTIVFISHASKVILKNPSSEASKKHLPLFHWLRWSLWLCGSQQTMENSQRNRNTRPPDLSPEKPVCRSRNNCQNFTWNSVLVQNWERRMTRLYIVTLLI